MTNATLLQSLLEAGEGSRELDQSVLSVLGFWFDPGGDCWRNADGAFLSERPTTSLDAALALASRVLPVSLCLVERDTDGSGWAVVQPTAEGARATATAATPPLALVSAILKALPPQSTEEAGL